MMSRSKDIIFLLGAGASAEADIPVSGEMINRV
jgi:NAD-dependent SIR2 family protein deacetylase